MYSISILTSLYKSEKYIVEFINKVKEVLIYTNILNFEFVIVNDGSPDGSIEAIKNNFSNKNLNIKIINLSKNFGHHNALITGMKYCSKDLTFLIDCDLEVNPNCLSSFYNILTTSNQIDCVSGVTSKKYEVSKKKFFTIFFSKIFYLFIKFFLSNNYIDNQVHVRLMKKKYVAAICQCENPNPFLIDLYDYVGFKNKYTEVDYKKRKETSYTLKKKIDFFFTLLLSNLDKILKGYFLLSFLSVVMSFIMIVNYIFKFYFLDVVPGYTSTILLINSFGSLILFGISLSLLYLSNLQKNARRLPNSIISSIINL